MVGNDFDTMIGRRLRIKRQLAGLNQQELGKQVGLSRAKIGEYENGKSSIPVSILFRLSQVLHVDMAFFFQPEIPSPEFAKLAKLDPMLTHEAILLLRDFSRVENETLKKEFAGILRHAVELIETKKQSMP